MKAEIKRVNGTLRLFVGGEMISPNAYITYFTNKSRYEDFADAGYKLFSVPVMFSSKTFNENSQAPCFGRAVFDGEDPRFDVVDDDIRKILAACPDALIFPRLNLSLPERWEIANPDELCDTGKAEIHRPCFSSDLWFEETCMLLDSMIDHMSSSDYAEHIIGYQLAGGNTEEWFSFDQVGSIGKRSREKFAEYRALYSIEDTEAEYYGFLSRIVADRICDLASFARKKIGKDLLIGTFYGYTFECPSRVSCHHALDRVLECPDIDFICSPVSYAVNRVMGRDHGCMLPCNSLDLHGKLYFAENDTRTHLIEVPFPHLPYFQNPVFKPKEFGDTVEMLKLHYARALIHGYALWWFDMWGGWYAHPTYMQMMRDFLAITDASLKKDLSGASEVAVFIDEKAYKHLRDSTAGNLVAYKIREALGKIGAPYDCFLASDFDAVKEKYKAYILLEPTKTPLSESIEEYVRESKVGCFKITVENCDVTPTELREFCKRCGVHIYSEKDAVIYANQSYLFVHTCSDGKLDISMPEGKTLKPLYACLGEGENYPEKYGCLFEIVNA